MRLLPFSCKTIPVVLALLVAATVSYGAPETVEVALLGECTDCVQHNIEHSHAPKGLRVTIDCKSANGEVKTRGSGNLDEDGKFRVDFPKELVKDGKLKEECYAQLHGASNTPCPTFNELESSKLSILSKTSDGKQTFSPVTNLKFSPAICTSAFLWPHSPKKSFPKIPFPHFKKPISFPPIWKKPFPPIPKIKKPCPPLVPIFKKPVPPPVPVYYKPVPPPVPVYKPPPVPVYYKPVPPPVPVYKPPPVPVYYKPVPPTVPVYKPPPVPVYYKPVPPPVPVYHKPLPPLIPKIKKPCPPIFKKKPIILPPLPKLPPFPKKPCPPIIPKLPFPKFPSHPLFKKPSWPTYPPHH
ncbi:hypothetical protein RND81_14G214800 [Saponaria officinalis]|uniref:Proline-rich protein n=1 Tax=Saponaria officinalis TaxID=3572 RepID=A0AAW1GTN2_SAPOF